MNTTTFDVTLTGELIDDRSLVIPALAALFKKTEKQVEALLNKAPVTVKKRARQDVARRYQKVLEQKGVRAELTPVSLPEPSNWSLEPVEEKPRLFDEALATTNAEQSKQDIYSTPKSNLVEDTQKPGSCLSLLQIYFSFEGRICRRTYWLKYFLVMFLINIALSAMWLSDPGFTFIIGLILAIPYIYVSVAVSVKRLHDINLSGWWYLLVFLPGLGGLAVFIMNGFIRGSDSGNNYGLSECYY